MASSLAHDKGIVIAIDFGTMFSGYAFSTAQDFLDNPLKISKNTGWIGGQLMSHKTRTAILLTPEKEFHKFGFEAEDKYFELASEGEHEEWYLFSHFKMLLHNKKNLSRDTTIEDETGKSMPAKTIFTFGISYLMEHALTLLNERGTMFSSEEVHWVLTVPAIWNEQAKQFMREAAQKAGIENNQLCIALEPEAAAMFCKHQSDKNGDNLFVAGSKFMVIDLGGGTADITAHQVESDGELRELRNASGGAWGGITVDNEFQKLLTTIVGHDVMEVFCREHKYDFIDLKREFEMKKRTIQKETGDKILIRVPVSLSATFRETTGKDIKDVISKSDFAGKVSWVTDKIRIDAKLIRNLFKSSIDNIIEHIRDILGELPIRGIKTFFMVGGYSESPIVQETMKQKFSNMNVITPIDAGLVVLKGAVMFGHRPMTIKSRVCRFTYGVAVSKPFIEGVHPKEKKYSAGGMVLCKDIFDKYVEIGSSLDNGEVKKCPVPYSSHSQGHSVARIRVYRSGDQSPEFVTDNGCSQLGELIVYLPEKEEDIRGTVEVKMSFGGTELAVEATETTTGRSYRTRFDFLSN